MPNTITTCVFCKIAAGQLPAYRIHENDLAFAILDINPIAKGHVLVIPNRHVERWHDMTGAETASLFNLAREVANRMMDVLKSEFVVSFARGRRIPHTHVFLLPTSSGDLLDMWFSVLEQISLSAPGLAEVRQKSSMEELAQMLKPDLP